MENQKEMIKEINICLRLAFFKKDIEDFFVPTIDKYHPENHIKTENGDYYVMGDIKFNDNGSYKVGAVDLWREELVVLHYRKENNGRFHGVTKVQKRPPRY